MCSKDSWELDLCQAVGLEFGRRPESGLGNAGLFPGMGPY